MKLLTKEKQKSLKIQKSVIFVKKILKINIWKIKKITKLLIILIMHGNIEIPRKWKLKKVKKLVANLHDTQIRNLKQALNHGLVLKKVQFNQNALIKPYIDMNTNLTKSNKWFWKTFF